MRLSPAEDGRRRRNDYEIRIGKIRRRRQSGKKETSLAERALKKPEMKLCITCVCCPRPADCQVDVESQIAKYMCRKRQSVPI
jgi:hypothetical protein